jgi:hypothetical protein
MDSYLEETAVRQKQLFRPKIVPIEARELLERENLLDCDILEYLAGRNAPKKTTNYDKQVEAYRNKRKERHELIQGLKTGTARINENGRLVAVPTEAPPRPPPPQPAEGPNNNIRIARPENEEQEQHWIEMEERKAAASIARAIERLVCDEGAAVLDEVQLIRIPRSNIFPTARANNFTFRRIVCAVLAVVTAFVCFLLHSFPTLDIVDDNAATVDRLLQQLFSVRLLDDHIKRCGGIQREDNRTITEKVLKRLGFHTSDDCSDGVLHVPSNGRPVSLTWRIPCKSLNNSCLHFAGEETCAVSDHPCFRGIHDNVISKSEVSQALAFAKFLIDTGGDHFDVRYEVSLLEQNRSCRKKQSM